MHLPLPLESELRPLPSQAALEMLSEAQRRAVLDPSPRSLVLAGAGSGKTRVLVARLVYLLQGEKIPPDQMLAFSFTRKACEEIATRLLHLCGHQGDEPFRRALRRIPYTFHAFSYQLVRRHFRRLGFAGPPAVIEAEEVGPVTAFAQFLSEDKMAAADEAASLLKRLRPCQEGHLPDPTLEPLETAFSAWKRRHNCLELSDQIGLALSLLSGEVGDQLRAHLKVVLVDEFQDIDDEQHALFKGLLGSATRFTLYGDDDQAIYRWRGSNPALIRSYAHLEAVTLHLLTTNYRCQEPILRVASQVVAGDPARVSKEAVAARRGGPRPCCILATDPLAAVKKAIDRLLSQGRAKEDIAILVRDHFDGKRAARAVAELGITSSWDLEQEGIRLLTYHGAKGLEFPVVLMPFLEQGHFPNRKRLTEDRHALKMRLARAKEAKMRLAWVVDRLMRLSGQKQARSHVPPWRALLHRLEAFCGSLNPTWRDLRLNDLSAQRERLAQQACWHDPLYALYERLPEEESERLSEERRLCYVAMTRAKDELWLVCSDRRHCSEFLREVRRRDIDWLELVAWEASERA